MTIVSTIFWLQTFKLLTLNSFIYNFFILHCILCFLPRKSSRNSYAYGFNAYWSMYVASDPSQSTKIFVAFREVSSHALTVATNWALSNGGYRPLQQAPCAYNQQMFKVCVYLWLYLLDLIFFLAFCVTFFIACFQGLSFVIVEANRYWISLTNCSGMYLVQVFPFFDEFFFHFL